MFPNSLYIDRRLFPAVNAITIFDAPLFMESRMRSGPGEHTLRADMCAAAFNGTALFSTEKSSLIGVEFKANPGTTLLRQRLGLHHKEFSSVILDPSEPNVVTFVGPRPVPTEMPEGARMIEIDELLGRFDTLNSANKATVAMLKFSTVRDPSTSHVRLGLGNGWGIQCIGGRHPCFILTENSTGNAAPDSV